MRRYAAGLVDEGLFESEEAARDAAETFASFDQGGTAGDRWRFGIDADVLDPKDRLRDLANWMRFISDE